MALSATLLATLLLLAGARADDPQVAAAFLAAGVPPKAISQPPRFNLTVQYPDGAQARYGNALGGATTSAQPALSFAAQPGALYSLAYFIVDSTINGAVCPGSQYLLWLKANVQGSAVAGTGATLAAHIPPIITAGKLCVFLILSQPHSIATDALDSIENNLVRNCFFTKDYMVDNGITEVYAGNFYYTSGLPIVSK